MLTQQRNPEISIALSLNSVGFIQAILCGMSQTDKFTWIWVLWTALLSIWPPWEPKNVFFFCPHFLFHFLNKHTTLEKKESGEGFSTKVSHLIMMISFFLDVFIVPHTRTFPDCWVHSSQWYATERMQAASILMRLWTPCPLSRTFLHS